MALKYYYCVLPPLVKNLFCYGLLYDGAEDQNVSRIRYFDEIGEECIREGNWNVRINRNNSDSLKPDRYFSSPSYGDALKVMKMYLMPKKNYS